MDKPMARVGKTTSLTPAPSVDSVPADAGLPGMITPSTAGGTPQGSPDQPAPLRCGTRTTWNWLPWTYWNFSLLVDSGPTGIWMHRLACVSVCILCSVCIPFSGEVQCKMHSTCNIVCLPSTTHFNIQGNTLNVASEVDCWTGKGVDQRTFGPIATPLPE